MCAGARVCPSALSTAGGVARSSQIRSRKNFVDVPQIDDAVVHVRNRVRPAGCGGVARQGVDGAVAGGAGACPALELLARVLHSAQASRIVSASLCGVGAGQEVAVMLDRGAQVGGWGGLCLQSREGHRPP